MANVTTSRSAKSRNPHTQRRDALFYGESPLLADAASQVWDISARLMGLTPEAWNLIRGSSSFEQLTEAADELRATLRAMAIEEPSRGTSAGTSCLVAQLRDGLREYRQRLQFVAANVPLDTRSRSLLTELLSFDRWMSARRESAVRGRELFPSPVPSPREQALRTIKRAALHLATTGARDDFKLVERIFRTIPELEAA